MNKNFLLLFLSALPLFCWAQIQSGPMLGYNSMREVAVWVQSKNAEEISFQWWQKGSEKVSIKSYQTKAESAFTAHLIADYLEPGTLYEYQIVLQNSKDSAKGTFRTQELWQHRKEPPNFSFITGSCAYTNEEKYDRPGEPYGKGNEIFETIAQQEADLMLWLGDNVYLREADWTSRSGIFHRYTHFKSQPELQALWKKMHHYAIWDDHDYGPNDADRSYIGKELTLEAFQHFWANPDYGANNKPGIATQFSYNDVDFFLLDNRYYRSPNARKTGKREILGEIQIQWLIDALVYSKASFKFVLIGGQFLNPAAVWENHATYAEEREKIIQLIEKENIKNVIFLSGDRHKTELSKLTLKNGNSIYDYTSSPLTSKSYDSSEEGNTLRIKGTHVSTQNFGKLSLSGDYKNRELTISTFNTKGEKLWEETITRE